MSRLLTILLCILVFCCESVKEEPKEIVLDDGWIKSTNGCLVFDIDLNDTDSLSWDGDCFENKLSGFGTLKKYTDNELIYEYKGNYINGKKLGIGKQTYLNGSFYEGEFYYKPHGSGKKTSPDGSSFHGIFRFDEPYTVVHKTREDTIKYLYEDIEISNEKAIELGMDKWLMDKIDYKLSNHITPDLNVPTTLYYDENWDMVDDKKKAKYYRLATFISPYKVKDNLVQDFYISGERQNKYYAEYVDINNTALEIRDGEDIQYYENGQIHRVRTYNHGEYEGNFKQYWPDGTIRKDVNFVDDQIDGIWKEYFENGNIEKELTYVDGILNGEMRYYHESGSISSIQYRKNADYHGDFIWYYEDGEIELKQSYTNDYVIPGSRIQFNKDGSGEKVFYENWGWNYEDWESEGANYSWEVNDDNNLLINQTISGTYKTKSIDFVDTDKVYSYELHFKKKSGKNLSGTGMYFNYKDDDNYTKFVVSSDGYYRVDRFFLGLSSEIKKWTKSSYINKSSGENKLKVIMLGEETIFSVNGKVVLNTEESMTDGNQFGVVADKGEYEITRFELNQPFSIKESKDLAMEDGPNTQPGSLGGINWKSSGSGIVLSKSGLIATNYHVVSDARHIEVELKYNGEIKSFKTRIVKTDEINDLAIIKIDDPVFESFGEIPYNFTTEIKKTGTKIYALGYPSAIYSDGSEGLMGKEIKFTDGRISAKTGINGSPIFYQTTAPLQGGNSGGPLFDENANLVGINTMILTSDKFENVSYSVKSRFLLNLIEVITEEFTLPSNYKTGRGSLEDQIEKISGYVALIKVK